jgi:hypothetical protein
MKKNIWVHLSRQVNKINLMKPHSASRTLQSQKLRFPHKSKPYP